MSEQVHNLLTRAMRGYSTTVNGISFSWDGDWFRAVGTATSDIGWRAYRSNTIPVKAGKTYTLSVEFADGMPDASEYISSSFQLFSDFDNNTYKSFGMSRNDHVALSFDQATLDAYGAGFQVWGPIIKGGATVDVRVRWMLVEGTTPAAWAPADGETLSGGGAQTSANLWSDSTASMQIRADGTYLAGKASGDISSAVTGLASLTENQTVHMGASLKNADAGVLRPFVEYKDAAGNKNRTGFPSWQPTGSWQRFEGTCVVPSGMTVCSVGFDSSEATGDIEVSNPVFSYGSPVTLASGAHTPYATQDHVAAEYATKAALKVTSDAVTAEVTERGKLAGRVGTLESTTDTHTSKLQQLASSIRSLVKGESTYTDPDGNSATSGIYSLVTQTRDAVTALFGSYTKTADLASTDAVRDAKKAGTDAASAASAAQSTADSAKSTADGLATMIRQDADGITVGKSADGKTWSTTHTRMGASAFEVLTKAGKVASSFGEKLIELGKNSPDAVIKFCGGKGIAKYENSTSYFEAEDGGMVALASRSASYPLVPAKNPGVYAHTSSDDVSHLALCGQVIDVNNSLSVSIDRFADAIQPVVLYNGGNALNYDTPHGAGTRGTVTLSESATHFKEMTIFYHYGGVASSVTLHSPNGWQAGLYLMFVNGADGNLWTKTRSIYISGTSITNATNAANLATRLTDGACVFAQSRSTPEIVIDRVEGRR